MSKQLRNMSPKSVEKALVDLDKKLPKFTGEEAHDKLITIVMRALYDRDGSGDFLWAHDLPIIKKIIKRKPEIRTLSMEWFAGTK